jgi:hypothetical protein
VLLKFIVWCNVGGVVSKLRVGRPGVRILECERDVFVL